MIRSILEAKNPKLREKSRLVTKIDKKILSLINDLKDTLAVQKDPEGVGLAAPQIGKNLKIFIVNYKEINKVIINPEILGTSTKKTLNYEPKSKGTIMEGCLSLPNFYGRVKREKSVRIKYLNGKGESVTDEFRGFFAQIVLHEIDHLDGVLFIDRLLAQKKPLYKLVGEEWEEVEI